MAGWRLKGQRQAGAGRRQQKGQGCRVRYQSDAIWALITDISTDISLISDTWQKTKPAVGCARSARNVSGGPRTDPRAF
eukprot:scaffold33115_cov174-Isochrysis_galbana.AAC.1